MVFQNVNDKKKNQSKSILVQKVQLPFWTSPVFLMFWFFYSPSLGQYFNQRPCSFLLKWYFCCLLYFDNVWQRPARKPRSREVWWRVSRDHCRDGSSAGGRSKRGAAPISGSPAPYINPSIWRQRSVPWRVWLNTQGPEVVSRPLGGFPGNDFTGRGSSISTSIIAGYFHTSAETHSPIGTPEGESKSKPTSCTNHPRQRYIAPPFPSLPPSPFPGWGRSCPIPLPILTHTVPQRRKPWSSVHPHL